jgi:hypothetical protein
VEDSDGPLIISAVYLPSKHAIKPEQLEEFYNGLGHRFITGGDYNATLGIQTYHTPRTRSIQNNEKKKLKTSILGRTHILAT